MTLNPVLRLDVLRERDPEEALRLLLSDNKTASSLDLPAILEDAVSSFDVEIEQSITRGEATVTLSLEQAELLSVALKSRKRPSHRPRLDRFQEVTHAATLALASRLAEGKRKQGIKAGRAAEEAAKEAAEIGGKYGATLSWTTIRRQMKCLRKKGRA